MSIAVIIDVLQFLEYTSALLALVAVCEEARVSKSHRDLRIIDDKPGNEIAKTTKANATLRIYVCLRYKRIKKSIK